MVSFRDADCSPKEAVAEKNVVARIGRNLLEGREGRVKRRELSQLQRVRLRERSEGQGAGIRKEGKKGLQGAGAGYFVALLVDWNFWKVWRLYHWLVLRRIA